MYYMHIKIDRLRLFSFEHQEKRVHIVTKEEEEEYKKSFAEIHRK